MKKLMIAAAIVCAAVTVNAASVGWSAASMNNFAGDKYSFFVIGQNGVTSVAAIQALLDAGDDISSYEYGKGAVAANGSAIQGASTSGKTLDAGTYTSFFVLFDDASPTAGNNNYCVISGIDGLTKTVGASSATVTFLAGNVSSIVNDSKNWKAFGPTETPEPTSAMLMLLGVAGLALKRKQK